MTDTTARTKSSTAPYVAEVEDMLRQAGELVAAGRPMPLSASVMINRDEVLELIEGSIERLPDELMAARWLLKERDEYLAKVQREGEAMIADAQARVAQMVQRSEVVKASQQRAGQILDRAEAQSRQMRHEVEDFCDQKLGSFEIILERTAKMVASGRDKLGASSAPTDEATPVDEPDQSEVFDQEQP